MLFLRLTSLRKPPKDPAMPSGKRAAGRLALAVGRRCIALARSKLRMPKSMPSKLTVDGEANAAKDTSFAWHGPAAVGKSREPVHRADELTYLVVSFCAGDEFLAFAAVAQLNS